GSEDLDRERVLVGCHAQVAERALVPVLDPGTGNHLGADEACTEAASLAAESLHADAGHRGEHDARRHRDVSDPPALGQPVPHAADRRRIAVDEGPSRGYHPAPPEGRYRPTGSFFRSGGRELKEVILTPEGHKKLQEEIEYLSTTRRQEIAERIRVAREFGDI